MSVIMTMIVPGDPARMEEFAAANPEKMAAIRDHAVEHGLIAHRFYGSGDQIMVIDEWPDEQSFRDFFGHMASEIGPMMQEVGITSEPQPVFWHKIESQDEYGWDG
jgi:quinol monooxygenase YgiN